MYTSIALDPLKHGENTQMEEELDKSRRMLEGIKTHNELHAMQERIVAEMGAKWAELQANAPPPQEVRFPVPAMPGYAAFRQPIVAVGDLGS